MLSIQISEKIKTIITALDDAPYILETLDILEGTFLEIENRIIEIAVGGNNITNIPSHINSTLNKVRGSFSEVKPRKFFSEIENLQSNILRVKENGLLDTSLVDELHSKLDNFSHAYESYIENYHTRTSAKMVLEAHTLLSLINSMKKGLLFYQNNIESEVFQPDDKRELTIILPSTMTLAEFIIKLQSIESIYKELCDILNVSLIDYPVEIVKIESGSLFAKLIGNNKIIELIASCIEASALFMYRNYTKEGKLTSLSRKVEAIESVLNLSGNLKEQDINVEEMSEHIQKSSITIAKELDVLISGEPQVKLNKKTLSIGNELQKKLLEESTILKLETDDK